MSSLSELDGGPCPPAQSLIDHFRSVATAHPETTAVICTHQPWDLYELGHTSADSGSYLRWTYETLDQALQRLTVNLSTYRLEPGTPFFLICQNRAEYVLASMAGYWLGLLQVPLNQDLLNQTDDIQYMVDRVLEQGKHNTILVMASTNGIAHKVDQLRLPTNKLMIVLDGPQKGWIPFEGLLTTSHLSPPTPHGSGRMVIFTSGTTSCPKGCIIRADRWFNALGRRMTFGKLSPGEKVAVPLPNSHPWGQICIFQPLLNAGSLVLAGPRFDPSALAKAIVNEECAFLALVPTMVHSLRYLLSKADAKCIKGFAFAGMVLTPALVQLCVDHFGVSQIENLYGMTEGEFITTGPVSDPSTLQKNHDITVGKPIPGCIARIYSADGQTILPRGVPGQLHVTGDCLASDYFTGHSEQFYEVDGRVWFNTGDQAIIDHEDQIFVVGRDKDIIVRGGENISPARIEGVLSMVPELADMDTQIVGQANDIAGEVPVAVVKKEASRKEAQLLRSTVRTVLGNMYVPADVISLPSLHVNDYPRTSSGKIIKGKLAELVTKRSPSQLQEQKDLTGEQITAAWASVLGVNQSQVDVDVPLTHLADSITMLITRDRLRRENGVDIPLDDWINASTIAEQIDLTEKSGQDDTCTQTAQETSLSSPSVSSAYYSSPGINDMIHLGGDPQGYLETKAAIQEALNTFCLSWNDVAAVTPCTDFMQIISKPRIVDTWNIRTTVLSKGATKKAMRSALESMLLNNSILLSFLVVDPTRLGPTLGLYVLIRQSRDTLDRCILDRGEVQNMQDVKEIAMDYPFKDHAKLPGPLFRALILYVEEMKSAVAITNISHCVLDKTFHMTLHDDLDRALGGQPLHSHVSYTSWADTYHTLRKSPVAEAAIAHHVSYLRNVKDHCHVVWPHPMAELTVAPERALEPGHLVTFEIPSLLRLNRAHPKVTAEVLVRSAVALLIISHTNHTHAFFMSFEGSRSKFPFVPPSSSSSSTAIDVAGPVLSFVLNLIAFKPQETVLNYLYRVQQESAELSQHSPVPYHEVFPRLNCTDDVLVRAAESLIFNWMPGLGGLASGANHFQNMAMTQLHIRTNIGMLANASLTGDGKGIVLLLEGSLTNRSTMWIERVGEELKGICLWLADERSWGKNVSEFLLVLRKNARHAPNLSVDQGNWYDPKYQLF